MKHLFYLLLLSTFVFSCGGGVEGETVEASEVTEQQPSQSAEKGEKNSFNVNVAESNIYWVGSKLTGSKHEGTINIKVGELETKAGRLTGGKFIIDMTSIKNTDLPPGEAAGLVGHLTDADFFDTGLFPEAVFTIITVEDVEKNSENGATHNITGHLQLKDVIKSITIPAILNVSDTGVNAETPNFSIDRTAWNVKYGSTLFGVAKDKAINNEIGLRISLVAS